MQCCMHSGGKKTHNKTNNNNKANKQQKTHQNKQTEKQLAIVMPDHLPSQNYEGKQFVNGSWLQSQLKGAAICQNEIVVFM